MPLRRMVCGIDAGGATFGRRAESQTHDQGTCRTTIPIAVKGGVSPGDIRWYQYWYRTTLNPPCGLWVNDFNLSNGYSITWAP